MKQCFCQSYNRPDLGGNIPPVVMKHRLVKKEGVCIDACMVSIIQKLWDNEIQTLGSCCGHNSKAGPPTVIVSPEGALKAKQLVEGHITIMCWELVRK